METITGWAAGVPFTALPPTEAIDGPAPLLVSWHMLDAPRTDAAFAAALPMVDVPAWRVHLGMPMCGARMVDGRVDAIVERIMRDPVHEYLVPFVHQAVAEFPAALVALRSQLPVDDGPIMLLGASLGAAVALRVLGAYPVPVGAVALVNPAVRVGTGVELIEKAFGTSYPWTAWSRAAVDELDVVASAHRFASKPPLLLVSGEDDHPTLRSDAVEFVEAFRVGHPHPDAVELVSVPGLAHPLADEPGLEPVAQGPGAQAVDTIVGGFAARAWLGPPEQS